MWHSLMGRPGGAGVPLSQMYQAVLSPDLLKVDMGGGRGEGGGLWEQ